MSEMSGPDRAVTAALQSPPPSAGEPSVNDGTPYELEWVHYQGGDPVREQFTVDLEDQLRQSLEHRGEHPSASDLRRMSDEIVARRLQRRQQIEAGSAARDAGFVRLLGRIILGRRTVA